MRDMLTCRRPGRWFGPLDGNNDFTAADFDPLIGHSVAVTDAAASVFAAELIAAYPEAKVVLNYRKDLDAWSVFSDEFWSCLYISKDSFLRGLEDKSLVNIPHAALMVTRTGGIDVLKQSQARERDGDTSSQQQQPPPPLIVVSGPRALLVLARLRPIHVARSIPRTRWQPGDGSR